jgi:hypothetical protein
VAVSIIWIAAGCAGGSSAPTNDRSAHSEIVAGVSFVPSSSLLLAACRTTAMKVGYAVPCPTRVPAHLVALGGTARCRIEIIGAACHLAVSPHSWRGWVVGSSVPSGSDEHLVIQAAPTVIADPAKAIDGPGWYRGASVKPLEIATLKGVTIRSYYVPPATNDGSAFSGHVVMVWSQNGHTYAVGFHNIMGQHTTEQLNLALLHGIRLVTPTT